MIVGGARDSASTAVNQASLGTGIEGGERDIIGVIQIVGFLSVQMSSYLHVQSISTNLLSCLAQIQYNMFYVYLQINKVNGVAFDAHDEHLLESFAAHIGVQLCNAQLHDAAMASQKRAEFLFEVTSAAASDFGKSGKSQDLMVLKKTRDVVESQSCAVYGYAFDANSDPKLKSSLIVISTENDNTNHISINNFRRLCASICSNRKSVVLYNNHGDDDEVEAFLKEEDGPNTGTINLAMAPIFKDNQGKIVCGVVVAKNKCNGKTFTEDDLGILHAYGRYVCTRWVNRALYRTTLRAQAKTQLLLESTAEFATQLNVGDLTRQIMERFEKLIEAERCTM